LPASRLFVQSCPNCRKSPCSTLGFLGLVEDVEANADHGRQTGGRISVTGPVLALVVATDEELLIARDTARVIAGD
jgi:acetate kinase